MTLKWMYAALLVAGGVVLLSAIVHWAAHGRRDPLRGSPLRTSRLALIHVWICLAAYFAGLYLVDLVGPSVLAGAGDTARTIVASSTANLLVTITTLLVAHATFLGGLRGFGIGRHGGRFVVIYTLAGWLVTVTVCGVVIWFTEHVIRIVSPGYQEPEHTVFRALQDPSVPVWVRVTAVVGAILLAPVGEELLFRGVLQTGLKKVMPYRRHTLLHRWLAILFTALIFGFMHTGTPQYIPALFMLAVVLGYIYERTGSLTIPILIHILFNGRSMLWYALQSQMPQG